jgi:hypothetical protein
MRRIRSTKGPCFGLSTKEQDNQTAGLGSFRHDFATAQNINGGAMYPGNLPSGLTRTQKRTARTR